MVKCDYAYGIEHGVVKIVDLDMGNVSVTNDAENVLTEIQSIENIKDKRIIYRDSVGQWDELIPTWNKNVCVDVSFKTLKGEL